MNTTIARITPFAFATLIGGMLLASTPTAAAAQAEDSRWLPWLGCWEAADSPAMLCVRPGDTPDAVDLLTVEDGEVIGTETIWADGVARDASGEGCEGEARAEFSNVGRRVYTRTELECGRGLGRVSSGIMAVLSANEWVDVRAVEVGGQSVAWVRRYRAAPAARAEAAGLGDLTTGSSRAVEAARMAAAVRIGINDLIDAAHHVDREAVRAWVAERKQPLPLDADALLRLAEAGVPDEVIDVAVAVSFPERFQVARQEAAYDYDRDRRYDDRWMGAGYGWWDPYRWDPYRWDRYRYGYGSRAYGSRGYGYGGYGGYYGGGYYVPGVVVVVPTQGEERGGRVVKGSGYQGRAGATGAGSAQPRGAVGTRSSTGSRPAASSGSSGSSSTGRKAKPRGGGGGEDSGS